MWFPWLPISITSEHTRSFCEPVFYILMGMCNVIKSGKECDAELGWGWLVGSMIRTEHMSGTDYFKLMIFFSFISLAKPGGSTITNNIIYKVMHLYIM